MNSNIDRVMFAGDWHGDTAFAVEAVRIAEATDCDVIVQLGDFGIWPGTHGQRYLDTLNAALLDAGMMLFFIDGNHEDFVQLENFPRVAGLGVVRTNIRHLPRGYRWTWSGVSFLALGGATSLDKASRVEGLSWWPQEELTAEDCRAAAAGGHADVMLTHDCPHGVNIPGINPVTDLQWDQAEIARANRHRARLSAVVDVVRPIALVHGHFHISYVAFRELTTIVGLADQGKRGNLYCVDLPGWLT